MSITHLDPSYLTKTIEGIKNCYLGKMSIATVSGLGVWLFDSDEKKIITAIFLLMAIDTFTGLWLAIKNHDLDSRGFYQVIAKFFVFCLMIMTGHLADEVVGFKIASIAIHCFLATNEAISILENIGLLGFPVPTNLLKILRRYKDKK